MKQFDVVIRVAAENEDAASMAAFQRLFDGDSPDSILETPTPTQAPQRRPYEQGFNEATGEVLVVFTPFDLQCAVKDDETGKTISETDARNILAARGSKIVDGILGNEWEMILQICTEEAVKQYQKETPIA